MSGPSAKIIADSISPEGVRLTTMQIVMHRFVLAEFNTARAFSRNSASSRAIPVEKMLDRFRYDMAIPLAFPAEQPGMQGGSELEGDDLDDAEMLLDEIHSHTYRSVMDYLGKHQKPQRLHKSVVNRLMEWGQWHTVVCTATAWENFFEQRCSPLAQPEIRAAADLMREAYGASMPQKLVEGEWHLPYITEEDMNELLYTGYPDTYEGAVKVSAARCARVSYLTQEGRRDIEEDLRLYDRLTTAKPAHWSPLEHVATPWPENRQDDCPAIWIPMGNGRMQRVKTDHLPRVGNLLGWRSLRTEVEAMQGEVTFR